MRKKATERLGLDFMQINYYFKQRKRFNQKQKEFRVNNEEGN